MSFNSGWVNLTARKLPHAAVRRLQKAGKALGEEAAAVIVHVFEKMSENNKRELATKADLENSLFAVRADLEKGLMALRGEMKEMENRLTLRLGGMMAASIAIVAALVKLL